MLYKPIIGASENYTTGNVHAETPADQLQRVSDLQAEYAQLKTDMQEEVNMMDTKLIQKAAEAKEHIQPLKKTIKKRQDKKLDFERYQGLVDNSRKKPVRSERENNALAKHEGHLTRATEEYRSADDHLKATLPPVTAAAFSILPHLLATQIMIQNTLLAQVYTTLHNYSLEHQFQSPPPTMQDVIAAWENSFKPIQNDLETGVQSIRLGKAIQKPMALGKDSRSSSLAVRSNTAPPRRSSAQSNISERSPAPSLYEEPGAATPPAIDASTKPKMSPSPSFGPQYVMPHRLPSGSALAPPNGQLRSAGSRSTLASSVASSYASPPASSVETLSSASDRFAPAAPNPDYFTRERTPQPQSASTLAASAASLAAAQKKKPPPPPPKRIASQRNWATALYDFDGQGDGDLVFREGDRIRIVEKTESVDDWWEGELKGRQGSFPANYVRVG